MSDATSDTPIATGDASLDTGAPPLDAGVVLPSGMVWERRFDGETHNRDVGLCAVAADDDTIVVGGFEVLDAFGGSSRSWLARLDGMGELVWLEHHDHAFDEAVAVTPSGRVLIASTEAAIPQGTGWLMATAGYTPDGVEQWRTGAPGAGAYEVVAVGEDAITVSMTADLQPMTWLARHDASGDPVFSILSNPGSGGFAVTADAETLVIAVADIPGGDDVLGTRIETYNAMTGDPVGTPLYLEGLDPKAITRDTSGIVLLASSGEQMQVARVGETGIMWSDTFGGMPLQFEWDMTLDPAGNIIIAGSQSFLQVGELRKYAADGTLTWTREYLPGTEIEINGVATTPSGDIIVVGAIRSGETDWDIWVSRWSP